MTVNMKMTAWGVATRDASGALQLDWDGKLHESIEDAIDQREEARRLAALETVLLRCEVVA